MRARQTLQLNLQMLLELEAGALLVDVAHRHGLKSAAVKQRVLRVRAHVIRHCYQFPEQVHVGVQQAIQAYAKHVGVTVRVRHPLQRQAQLFQMH